MHPVTVRPISRPLMAPERLQFTETPWRPCPDIARTNCFGVMRVHAVSVTVNYAATEPGQMNGGCRLCGADAVDERALSEFNRTRQAEPHVEFALFVKMNPSLLKE